MQIIEHAIKKFQIKTKDAKKDANIFMMEIDQIMKNEKNSKAIKDRMSRCDVQSELQDYGNFKQTFDFFLDNLICEHSQNIEDVKNYDQLLQLDFHTEKIRQSCHEFILRRVHNSLFEKMTSSEWDKALMKVI